MRGRASPARRDGLAACGEWVGRVGDEWRMAMVGVAGYLPLSHTAHTAPSCATGGEDWQFSAQAARTSVGFPPEACWIPQIVSRQPDCWVPKSANHPPPPPVRGWLLSGRTPPYPRWLALPRHGRRGDLDPGDPAGRRRRSGGVGLAQVPGLVHRLREGLRDLVFAVRVRVGAVVRVEVDVVRGGGEARRSGERGASRSATVFARSSLKEATSVAKGASDSARTFGITGRSTRWMRGFAARASAMKVRAFAAVCSAFV